MHDYLIDSARTVSTEFHDEIVPVDLILGAIAKRLEGNPAVDGRKKSLFYGRDLTPELENAKMRAFDGDDFGYTVENDIVHALLGIDTEAAELLEHLRDALVFGTEIDRAQVINEAGDILWYLAVLFRKLGVTFEDVGDLNLAKLRRRFPEKFTAVQANHRNLAYEDQVFAIH